MSVNDKKIGSFHINYLAIMHEHLGSQRFDGSPETSMLGVAIGGLKQVVSFWPSSMLIQNDLILFNDWRRNFKSETMKPDTTMKVTLWKHQGSPLPRNFFHILHPSTNFLAFQNALAVENLH